MPSHVCFPLVLSLQAVRFPLVVTGTKAGMTPAELREYVRSVFLAAATVSRSCSASRSARNGPSRAGI